MSVNGAPRPSHGVTLNWVYLKSLSWAPALHSTYSWHPLSFLAFFWRCWWSLSGWCTNTRPWVPYTSVKLSVAESIQPLSLYFHLTTTNMLIVAFDNSVTTDKTKIQCNTSLHALILCFSQTQFLLSWPCSLGARLGTASPIKLCKFLSTIGL